MTTHFEALYKGGRFGERKTGLCAKWAMSHKYMETTTDQSQVDCVRCAKALGIQPKAKAAAKNPTGTCQACFGSFKVPNGERISLHGYERPGYGYILGRCIGAQQSPYEFSCEVTKQMRASLGEHYNRTSLFLESMKLNNVETYETRITVGRGERKPGTFGRSYAYETITIKRGDEAIYGHPRSIYNESIPSFEDARKSAIRKTEHQLAELSKEIEFLRTKIIDWKEMPLVAR